jgi:subtilase family serine protease
MFLFGSRSFRATGIVAIPAAVAAFTALGPAAVGAPVATGGDSSGLAAAAGAARTALAGSRPAWALGARPEGRASSSAPVATEVYLAGHKAALAVYARAVSNPFSPYYRHFLSPAAAIRRFGPTGAQVRAVEQWLSASGLRPRRVSAQEIEAAGTTGAAERAYGTVLEEYEADGGTFRAPAAGLRVPSAIAPDVLSVSGLANMPALMRPASLTGAGGPARIRSGAARWPMSKGADGAVYLGPRPCSAYWGQRTDGTDPRINGAHQPYVVCGYTPQQLRSAYDLPPAGTGQGVTVAITDAYGSPTIVSDANAYATGHGGQPFAPGQYRQTVTPASWTGQADCGGTAVWADEETLDVEAVHAIAPAAGIRYYGANSCDDQGFLGVFSSIIDTHAADVITSSWGQPISASVGSEPASVIGVYTQLFEQAAVEGIEVSFSAGDCGAEDPRTVCGAAGNSTQAQADFPSSDPWVTSVGGTAVEIGKAGTAARTVPWGDDLWVRQNRGWESLASIGYDPHGWYYGGGGGTSGPSTDGTFPGFAEPWYQRGVVPGPLAQTLPTGRRASRPMRVTPDVSMDADPQTGFLVGQTQVLPDGSTGYAESDVGGTSLASPLFAGLVADSIQQHTVGNGFLNPVLYLDEAFAPWAFGDVVSPSAAAAPYAILPSVGGAPAAAVRLGDDELLIATPGYDDATGLGTPAGLIPGPARP